MVRAELATTLCALKEFDRARELQTQALEQARESFGPKHPKVAELLSGLGEILFRLELLADSEAVLREGIAIAQETPDPNLPELSYLLRRLAQVECARDRAVDAKVTVEQAVEMQRTALGDHHIELAKTLELQARIVEDLGEPEAAAAAREQAREIRGQAGLREAGID
jgi:tetratricopeptide (TPR) repeat protein